MILNVYSHILDDDRRKNAKLFEKAFYEKKELDPDIHQKMPENMLQVPEGVDPELLGKVLADPEMAALLVSMASKMNSKSVIKIDRESVFAYNESISLSYFCLLIF